jgi:hypothetical protein
MSWDDARQATQGGLFAKLRDGEVMKGVIMGEPCAHQDTYQGRTFRRIAVNFLDLEDERVKILNLAPRWFKQILAIKDTKGLDRILKVKRIGMGTDTVYSIDAAEDEYSASTKKLMKSKEEEMFDLPEVLNSSGDGDEPPF